MSDFTTTSGETIPTLTPSSPNIVFSIPNMNHTLQIKFSDANFPSWKTQIMAFVKAQDSYGFLDGTSTPPTLTIPNPSITPNAPTTIANPEFLAWCQRDQMLLSLLISTLTEPLVVHAVGCATAHQLWTTLVPMFASQARSRVLQIHYQLATSKKGSASITEFSQTFKALCDNLVLPANTSTTLNEPPIS